MEHGLIIKLCIDHHIIIAAHALKMNLAGHTRWHQIPRARGVHAIRYIGLLAMQALISYMHAH